MIGSSRDHVLGLYRAHSHRRHSRRRLLLKLTAALLALLMLAACTLVGALGYVHTLLS